MKHLKNTLVRFGFAAAIAFGLGHAISFAQEVKPNAEVDPFTASEADNPHLDDVVKNYKVDIVLEQTTTTFADYVELIKDQIPVPLNFVMTRDAASVSVPPIKLKQVSVQAALNAAAWATDDQIGWGNNNGETIEVYAEPNSAESVSVVNVSDILETTEEASLLSAIEIG